MRSLLEIFLSLTGLKRDREAEYQKSEQSATQNPSSVIKEPLPQHESQKTSSTSEDAVNEIPAFNMYFPSEDAMDEVQLNFYKHLERCIDAETYPSVNGNISYLFVYAYKVIDRWQYDGFKSVYDRLIDLAEAYPEEEKFSQYCWHWAEDCLLGMGAYDRWLELTELTDPVLLFKSGGIWSDVRCTVNYRLGYSVNAVDLYRLANFYTKPTATTRRNAAQYRDCLEIIFDEIAEEEGPWMDRFFAIMPQAREHPHYLFNGVPIPDQPQSDIGYFALSRCRDFMKLVAEASREAENRLRETLELPRIGEEWVTETELFHQVRDNFPQTRVVHHGKPEWLGKQHLDIWIPRWRIAIEYHGQQHFEPIEYFGGEETFQQTKERDKRKAGLCKANNVILLTVTADDNFEDVIEHIDKIRKENTA